MTLHGHAQPEIAAAIAEQAARLEQVIFANFTHEPAEKLCQGLAERLPGGLQHCFFSDNGSTSVEVALKMATQYWWNRGQPGRTRMLAFEGAYHGDTLGALALGERSLFSAPFEPLLMPVDRLPYPETWDGDDRVEEKEHDALAALDQALQNADLYTGLIIEPLIQGCAGMRFCRPQFLQQLAKRVRAAGLLLIFDEVMTGFGRTGDLFACLKAKVQPDLICLSKGITGGFLPLGVTVSTTEVFEAFCSDDPRKTFYHGHSYTANPIACAAALASQQLLDQRRYTELETRHRIHLESLLGHPRVSRARVCGTIAAFNLCGEQGYLADGGRELCTRCLEHGVFLRPLGNVVYVLPPYCISESELERVYCAIEAAL